MAAEQEVLTELLYKKALYLLPGRARIYVIGNKLSVQLGEKKLSDISSYAAERVLERAEKRKKGKAVIYRVGLPITYMGAELGKEYKQISEYFDKHKNLRFLQFEYATSHDLPLCTFFKETELIATNKLLTDIHRELPYLINIFRRPLIHLKGMDIVQPVDTVKRINHNTIKHLSRHAENWKDIDPKSGGIVPARLLTMVYDDDYGIYENIVFRDLVDVVMGFLRKRIRNLTEILETFTESIELDPVYRFNHQEYYLAIGKLYVGFYKTGNSAEILAMLEKARFMYKQLSRYKSRAVYTKNSGLKRASGELKRTNILMMHKDYRHVYSLYGTLQRGSLEVQQRGDSDMQDKSRQSYEQFCQMLVLFAAANFNLTCPSTRYIYQKGKLNAQMKFKDWAVKISAEDSPVLGGKTVVLKATHSRRTVKYVFIPISHYIAQDRRKLYEIIVQRMKRSGAAFDKYVFCEPFDYEEPFHDYAARLNVDGANLQYAVLPLAVSEINSFRRVQKLLLECLVSSNRANDCCAFCGEQLIKEGDNKYLCAKCRTAIRNIECAHCGKEFVATYISAKKRKKRTDSPEKDEDLEGMSPFFRHERLYSFRNITNMSNGNFVCPHCGGENSK